MMKKALGVIATVAVMSCGGSTDVVVTGPGTYMIALHSTQEESSGLQEKARALEEAQQYCAKSGRKLETIRAMDVGPGGGSAASSAAEVHFRCVTADTPQ